jgi:serine/threonine-protein kinase
MDRIVLTAMAKDVDARYPSAQDLRADLLRFERGRPLVGAPIPVPVLPHTAHVAAPLAPVPAAAAIAPPPARRRGRWGPAVVIGIALTLLVAMIVVLLANSDFGDEAASTPTLDVPSVTGTPYAQAEATLQGLKFKVVRQDVDEPQQAPDLVLAQDPEAGRKYPKGGTIALQVSSPSIAMPNVVGQSRAQASQTLARSYLLGTYVEEDSDQPPGTVLRSDPAAGGPVPKLPQGGSPTVTVVVAREPLVPVPDITGQDPTTALATLTQAGFQATQTDTSSETVPAGGVIGTYPPAGTPLAKGTAVTLLVSTGPSLVEVPSVVGQTRAAAESVLHDQLGFGLTISFTNAGPTKKGLVVSQSPSGGQAPRGSGISIVVGI